MHEIKFYIIKLLLMLIISNFQSSTDSNPSSPGSGGSGAVRKETKGRRKQSYPVKAPVSPLNYAVGAEEQAEAQDYTAWSKREVGVCFFFVMYSELPIEHASGW